MKEKRKLKGACIEKDNQKAKNLNARGITLIALVITIIVLLILAGVTIATLTGENGILTKASEATIENCHATVKDSISLVYNEYQIELNTSESASDFFDFLKRKNYIQDDGTIRVKDLTGETLSLGNGIDGKDIYIIEEDTNSYILKYYDEEADPEELWNAAKKNSDVKTITIYDRGELVGQDITIQYEDGMSWKDFLNSKYNNGILGEKGDGRIIYRNTDYWIQDSNGESNILEDIIDANKGYCWAVDR